MFATGTPTPLHPGATTDPGATIVRSGALDEVAPAQSAVQPAATPAPRRRFGKYEIVRELGRGGMGVVYQAFHPGLKTHFAIKVLLAGTDASAEEAARFRTEAQASARLRHPGIIGVHDIGVEDGKTYIAMEYVEGVSLDQVLVDPTRYGIAPARRSTPATAGARLGLNAVSAVRLARQIAVALQAAHEAGVIHRDLKPQNVLLVLPAAGAGPGPGGGAGTGPSQVKVMDFGQGDGTIPATWRSLGRPLLPERTQPRAGASDPAGWRGEARSERKGLEKALAGAFPRGGGARGATERAGARPRGGFVPAREGRGWGWSDGCPVDRMAGASIRHTGTAMKRLRLYVDTSVVGGCLDERFQGPSTRLFEEFRAGRFTCVVSSGTLRELMQAPEPVRSVMESVPPESLEQVEETQEVIDLAERYLAAGVVPEGMVTDALHIACASVYGVDVVVSWNFKHMVNLARIRGYNAVNLRLGYAPLEIRSPWEVIDAD